MALLLDGGSGGAAAGGSTLAWDVTTHGVTLEGMNGVLEQIKLVMIDNAIVNLNNTAAVQEAVQAGWSGTDCDQWLTNFNALRQEIVDSLEFYYNQIEAEFQKIFTEWENFQASNVTQG